MNLLRTLKAQFLKIYKIWIRYRLKVINLSQITTLLYKFQILIRIVIMKIQVNLANPSLIETHFSNLQCKSLIKLYRIMSFLISLIWEKRLLIIDKIKNLNLLRKCLKTSNFHQGHIKQRKSNWRNGFKLSKRRYK